MKNGRVRRVGILVAITLMVGSAVMAQGGPFGSKGKDPFVELSQKLDQILKVITPDPPEPPEPGPVTLSTGFVQKVGNDSTSCLFANIGPTTLTVTITLRDLSGDAVTLPVTRNIPSGQGSGFGAGISGTLRCEFSFVGFATDVRANMLVIPLLDSATAVSEAR